MRIRFKKNFPFFSIQTHMRHLKSHKVFVPGKPNIKHVGKCTYCAPDLYITNVEETTIGSFCSIGRAVCLGWGRHPTQYLTTSPYIYADYFGYKTSHTVSHNEYIEYTPPVHIGNDVWIGDFVAVANGISVGNGAIIASRAVVTKDVPPYSIVGGIPAKFIKYRFDQNIRQILEQLPWWTLPDELIRQIPYDNMEQCITFLRKCFVNQKTQQK